MFSHCMSAPSATNVSFKISEKLSKYKDLEIEVTKMRHLKSTTLSVTIGALGMVANTTLDYVSQIPGAPSLTELKKSTHGHLTYPAKGTINVISLFHTLQT